MYLKYLFKNTIKKIWLFDTFSNFPKSNFEKHNYNINLLYKNSYFSTEKIKNNFKNLNLDKNIKIIDGNLDNTINQNDLEIISILRIDCDLYQPTLLTLNKLYPKIVYQGVILIDDYQNNLVNCKKAVDEFRLNNQISSPIIFEKNGDSIFWIKNS